MRAFCNTGQFILLWLNSINKSQQIFNNATKNIKQKLWAPHLPDKQVDLSHSYFGQRKLVQLSSKCTHTLASRGNKSNTLNSGGVDCQRRKSKLKYKLHPLVRRRSAFNENLLLQEWKKGTSHHCAVTVRVRRKMRTGDTCQSCDFFGCHLT